jgi:hypothetical protein
VLAIAYLWAYSTTPENPRWFSRLQILGMLATYAALPPYLLAALVAIWRGAERNIALLSTEFNEQGHELARRVNRVPRWWWLAVIGGGVFGAYGYTEARFSGLLELSPHYFCLLVGNTLVWMAIGYTLSLRTPAVVALLRLGLHGVSVSIHEPERLKPFANIAFRDLLLIVGAMSFMALQSLDAQLRWDNYSQGLLVGIPWAVIVFVFPLWGVHRAMQKAKSDALMQARQVVAQASVADIPNLEAALSYRDRIASTHTWPLDIQAVYRIFLYLIIPPVAWVAAALVENWVGRLIS